MLIRRTLSWRLTTHFQTRPGMGTQVIAVRRLSSRSSGRVTEGPRNMKSMWPPFVAILLWLIFTGPGGRPPRAPWIHYCGRLAPGGVNNPIWWEPHTNRENYWKTYMTEKNSPVKGWGGLSKMSKNVKMSIHPTTHRWEWLLKSKIVKDNWIILKVVIYLIISDWT